LRAVFAVDIGGFVVAVEVVLVAVVVCGGHVCRWYCARCRRG
jgi:hypothetical protein